MNAAKSRKEANNSSDEHTAAAFRVIPRSRKNPFVGLSRLFAADLYVSKAKLIGRYAKVCCEIKPVCKFRTTHSRQNSAVASVRALPAFRPCWYRNPEHSFPLKQCSFLVMYLVRNSSQATSFQKCEPKPCNMLYDQNPSPFQLYSNPHYKRRHLPNTNLKENAINSIHSSKGHS